MSVDVFINYLSKWLGCKIVVRWVLWIVGWLCYCY